METEMETMEMVTEVETDLITLDNKMEIKMVTQMMEI